MKFNPLVTKANKEQAEKTFNLWYWEAIIFEIAFLVVFLVFLNEPSLLSFGLGTWFLLISLFLHVVTGQIV
jgi:hypothetical protein